MTYAIIQLGGKQYRVTEGEKLTIDRIPEELRTDNTVKTTEVLLVKTDTDTKIGQPFVSGASVTCKVLGDERGDKLRIFKFKAKSRYRRTQGHRQELTVLEVSNITA